MKVFCNLWPCPRACKEVSLNVLRCSTKSEKVQFLKVTYCNKNVIFLRYLASICLHWVCCFTLTFTLENVNVNSGLCSMCFWAGLVSLHVLEKVHRLMNTMHKNPWFTFCKCKCHSKATQPSLHRRYCYCTILPCLEHYVSRLERKI